jgi:signal transduction histidine kinase
MADARPGRARRLWRLLRPFVGPLLLWGLVAFTLREPLGWWLSGENKYDREALKEWLEEARVGDDTLPEMVDKYLAMQEEYQKRAAVSDPRQGAQRLAQPLAQKRQEIEEHLKALGTPATKIYPGQLPLFPVIYWLSVSFDEPYGVAPIVWDSELPRQKGQYQELAPVRVGRRGATVELHYRLHAFTQQQHEERQRGARQFWLGMLGVLLGLVVLSGVYLAQRRERDRAKRQAEAEHQLSEAERRRLQEELRRQEAERHREEAERQALELKSQLFANIGIMAGAYAHNIKNLLVRPNDLLRTCLQTPGLPAEQGQMLREVDQTLRTVTERLQQILQTVRRDPTRADRVRLDLNGLVREMARTWAELADEKWKMQLTLDLAPGPVWIQGDHSHLQQAVENLVFNARDATFEMRNSLREQARKQGEAPGGRRQALIAAASWKGAVVLRTRREGDTAVLDVQDNGIGMSEEVRRRCTETHFSTKRNNALFTGMSAGMGLGLSFVVVILEHHGAKLAIESKEMGGATFRVSFPLKKD